MTKIAILGIGTVGSGTADIFEDIDFPWEVLPKIKDFVVKLGETLSTEEYEQDLFLNGVEALDAADENTVVIVVDTNKPSYTECDELLTKCKTIVVIDHHRQGTEKIENATLSYIEPYASSACEMVAEIIQYISDTMKIKQVEADCIYSGMMIDTNNFLTKTGVRTFEAAAFLRRCRAQSMQERLSFSVVESMANMSRFMRKRNLLCLPCCVNPGQTSCRCLNTSQ